MMTQEMLQNFSGEKGWKWVENSMVGVCGDYPFVTRLRAQTISVLTTVFTISGKLSSRVCRRLKKELPQGCSVTGGSGPTLVCSGQDNALLETHAAAMELVTAAMREEGIGVPDCCPLCKQGSCDALALLVQDQAYLPVHWTCCEERTYSTVTRAQIHLAQGSYWTGLAGAVLGGLVTIIPSVLTIWFQGHIYAFLFLLIPLGVYFGYRLFRGKMNHVACIITAIVSLIMPLILEQTVFFMVVSSSYHLLPNPLDTVRLYFSYYTLRQIALAMAMPYIFLLLGLWMAWRQITRASVHEVQDANAVLDSMIPFRNRGSLS